MGPERELASSECSGSHQKVSKYAIYCTSLWGLKDEKDTFCVLQTGQTDLGTTAMSSCGHRDNTGANEVTQERLPTRPRGPRLLEAGRLNRNQKGKEVKAEMGREGGREESGHL